MVAIIAVVKAVVIVMIVVVVPGIQLFPFFILHHLLLLLDLCSAGDPCMGWDGRRPSVSVRLGIPLDKSRHCPAPRRRVRSIRSIKSPPGGGVVPLSMSMSRYISRSGSVGAEVVVVVVVIVILLVIGSPSLLFFPSA